MINRFLQSLLNRTECYGTKDTCSLNKDALNSSLKSRKCDPCYGPNDYHQITKLLNREYTIGYENHDSLNPLFFVAMQTCWTAFSNCVFETSFSDFTFWCGLPVSHKKKHFIEFAIRVVFSSLLVASDIVSDFITGFDFLHRGDMGWATFTFVIIFAPWFARLLILLINLPNCFTKSSSSSSFGFGLSQEGCFLWKEDLIDSLLELPLLQTFRWVAFCFKYTGFRNRSKFLQPIFLNWFGCVCLL